MSQGIYEKLLAAGCEMSNHESDLYVKATETAREILKGYEHRENVTTFKNNIDGLTWYDVPFAYTPWWDKRLSKLTGGIHKKMEA